MAHVKGVGEITDPQLLSYYQRTGYDVTEDKPESKTLGRDAGEMLHQGVEDGVGSAPAPKAEPQKRAPRKRTPKP